MNSTAAAVRCLSIMLVTLLVSCVQAVRPQLPVQLQQAERHNMKGVAAEARQQFTAAETEFLEAYRLFSAVENYRGMVITLLNCSRLYRFQGDAARTDKVLAKAVALMPQVPALTAEISFEMTKLAQLNGDQDSAVNWAAHGVQHAFDKDRPRMLNLLASTYYQTANYLQSREVAESALQAARRVSDKREEANSLRLLGDIAYEEKRLPAAMEIFSEALTIDKELALSRRVSADLRGLARTSAASGNPESAVAYYQRSVAINRAEREYERELEDLEALRKIFEQTGNNERLAETVEALEQVKLNVSNQPQR